MKTIITDGAKSLNLLDTDDPSVWTFFGGMPQSSQNELYARVAAAFRAYNLKANTVGNMPFTLYKGDEEYDTSATWENKVGFMPNPSDLFRLNTLSYIATNTWYNLRTTDVLGYKTKNLLHAVSTTFTPYVNPNNGQLERIVRITNGKPEEYTPDDKRLVRMWRLDHTTELLPSPNTEAKAIMNAAGEIYYADLWIKHFYERGGIAPTVIAMKGMVAPDKKNAEEQSWGDWLRGLGKYLSKPARVFNADALDVKQFGSAVTDLKNNDVYNRAIANIAMGTGMPLSLLLANSANRATAQEESATWYENDIIPFCNWMAYGYNEQVFKPMGLRLEFTPESMDDTQEEKLSPKEMIDVISSAPTAEICLETFNTLGIEVTDKLKLAIEKWFAKKEAEPVVVNTQPAQPVTETEDDTVDMAEDDTEEAAKWIPNLDQIRELQRWQELAFRKFKRGDDMAFEWRNDTLPEEVYKTISANLPNAKEESAIKQVFDMGQIVTAPVEVKAQNDILKLAEALNRLADVEYAKHAPVN